MGVDLIIKGTIYCQAFVPSIKALLSGPYFITGDIEVGEKPVEGFGLLNRLAAEGKCVTLGEASLVCDGTLFRVIIP